MPGSDAVKREIVWREAVWEYLRGALWVMPAIAVAVALAFGAALSQVNPPRGSWLRRLEFQGTVDDARTLLIGTAGTMITVIALMLGLTVVALQMSSTQYSPRLLRNFLRDRPNQVVLSAFVATFAYSMAGLYTVGVSGGNRTSDYPRFAVTWAIVLLFLSLAALVYEVHHVSHSMQVDEIMRKVERHTRAVVRSGMLRTNVAELPEVPPGAVTVLSRHAGYVQTVHPELALDAAAQQRVHIRIATRSGEYLAAGAAPLAWVWPVEGPVAAVDVERLRRAVELAVRIGFERTLQQDAGFGMRQLVDVASKALSPAVNDPYTAVQAIDHLTSIMASLARRELGPLRLTAADSPATVSVPALGFGEHLELACGQIRRYGCSEPRVMAALIRLLRDCAAATRAAERHESIALQLRLIEEDAQRAIVQPADLLPVREDAAALRGRLLAVAVDEGREPKPRSPATSR